MPGKTSNNKQDADTRNVRNTLAAYSEVCRSYHAVDDFRAKLLAVLPIVSGSGGFLLLANAKKTAIAPYVGYIGVFGALVTFGLACYEWRGLENCSRLINTGRKLEKELQLKHGQFLGGLEDKVWGWINATTASAIVYGATLVGWICVAGVGFYLNGFPAWLSIGALVSWVIGSFTAS